MEIQEDKMVVMTTDCSFYAIKKKDFLQEGMEIEFDSKDIIPVKRKSSMQSFLVAAAMLFLVISSVFGSYYWKLFHKPVAIITVDINPSIQLEVNQKKEIVDVIALNQDAEKLALETLKRKPLQVALAELLQQLKDNGYIIHQEENYILVTTVILEEDKIDLLTMEELLKEAKENLEGKASKEGAQIEVITTDASQDMLKKARKQQTSVGRLKICEEIQEAIEEDIDINTMQHMKIKELIKIRKEIKKKKDHPVFDTHPSEKNDKEKIKKDKEDPDFEKHPDKKENEVEENKVKKEHPVFDTHPSENNKNKGKSQKEDKSKEVDRYDDKDKKRHPVFEEDPGNKGKSNLSNEKQKQDGKAFHHDKNNRDKVQKEKRN